MKLKFIFVVTLLAVVTTFSSCKKELQEPAVTSGSILIHPADWTYFAGEKIWIYADHNYPSGSSVDINVYFYTNNKNEPLPYNACEDYSTPCTEYDLLEPPTAGGPMVFKYTNTLSPETPPTSDVTFIITITQRN